MQNQSTIEGARKYTESFLEFGRTVPGYHGCHRMVIDNSWNSQKSFREGRLWENLTKDLKFISIVSFDRYVDEIPLQRQWITGVSSSRWRRYALNWMETHTRNITVYRRKNLHNPPKSSENFKLGTAVSSQITSIHLKERLISVHDAASYHVKAYLYSSWWMIVIFWSQWSI